MRGNNLVDLGAMTGTPKEVARRLKDFDANQVLVIEMDQAYESGFVNANRAPLKLIVTAVEVLKGGMAGEKQKAAFRHYKNIKFSVQIEGGKVNARVASLVPSEVLPPTKLNEAMMLVDAKMAVLNSGDWIKAEKIARLACLSERNPSAQPNKWKKDGAIFAITHHGTDYFPFFGLDPDLDYRPFKQLRAVLEILAPKLNAWGLAFWFSSLNGFLDDQRPQDLMATDADKVIGAAKEEMAGILHG